MHPQGKIQKEQCHSRCKSSAWFNCCNEFT